MKQVANIAENQVKLLSTIDLEEVCQLIAGIVTVSLPVKSCGIAMWDGDMEAYTEHFSFGEDVAGMQCLLESYGEQDFDRDAIGNPLCLRLDAGELPVSLCAAGSVFAYAVGQAGEHKASIFLAGTGELASKDIEHVLAPYPLWQALANAWDVHELRRENVRLRAQYEEMENANHELQEQTRTFINDSMIKNTLHIKQIEREKLVYELSNFVRSSVEIVVVLQTSVDKIGKAIGLSRCLILRPDVWNNQLGVFEYHSDKVKSIKEIFASEDGEEFARMAMTKSAPHAFGDPLTETTDPFDRELLRKMKIRSGLLVPIIMRERTIGSLFLQDCAAARPWSIDDSALFGSLANQLSVAIENADLHEEKKRQAVTDGLTGIANRRHFNEAFAREFERTRRYNQPLSLVIADLDYLKKINDTHGHPAGDEAIRMVGRVLANSCRSIDLPARYGGEEFCLLLPNTDVEEATFIAERIRKLISEADVEGVGQITASVGVATAPAHADEPQLLIDRADAALYEAKNQGRNRVFVWAQK